MHVPDGHESLIAAHAIEEIMDELENAVLPTRGQKGRVAGAVGSL